MGRRIAFCSDGTWDTVANNTNVYRMSKAIVAIPGEQFSFYDDGVGSDGTPIQKLLGGAFGTGLFQKIKDGYSMISSVYEAADEAFIFGFSRGAYTGPQHCRDDRRLWPSDQESGHKSREHSI